MRDDQDVLALDQPVTEDRERGTPDPGDGVGGSDHRAEPARDASQGLGPLGRCCVEVHLHDHERDAVAAAATEQTVRSALDPVEQHRAVHDTGGRVAHRIDRIRAVGRTDRVLGVGRRHLVTG